MEWAGTLQGLPESSSQDCKRAGLMASALKGNNRIRRPEKLFQFEVCCWRGGDLNQQPRSANTPEDQSEQKVISLPRPVAA